MTLGADETGRLAGEIIQIKAILGIGGKRGFYGDESLFASGDMIGEWGYPDIGIMICMMPSGGGTTPSCSTTGLRDHRENRRWPTSTKTGCRSRMQRRSRSLSPGCATAVSSTTDR